MEQVFKVPIRNIFNMLSYMQELPEMIEDFSSIDEDLITYDFMAKQFLKESHILIRKGLLKDYLEIVEETGTISGKMMMTESIPSIVQRKPVVVCEKDIYSENIIFNQIMVTTLVELYQNQHINHHTRKEAFNLLDQLSEIDVISLSRGLFIRLSFGKHNTYYKRMLYLARLLHEARLLSHKQGDWSLYTIEISDSEMNKLFEKFLFHFYRIEQDEYTVKSEKIRWHLIGNESLLPSMNTDVSLLHRYENKRIVIDAKFYKNIFQQFHGKNSFHSHNMYQIFAYMMHQPIESEVRGILIYPENYTEEISERYDWDDRLSLEIYSLNLDYPWQKIKERLMGILN